MTGKPTVSVLMAVYNAEEYLRAAVESILKQTFTDFEFVIVDDGSTDRTASILKQYAQQDSRIVLVEQDNSGQVRALNNGLASCRGELVARMDADDVALPQRFAEQVSFLNSNPDCLVVGTAMELIDSEGDLIGIQIPPCSHEEIESSLFEGMGAVPHPTAMIRREFLTRVNGYDESILHCEDLDLWLRLSEVGRLANIPTKLLQYRMHENSITASKRREQIENVVVALKSACERRGIRMDLTNILQAELAEAERGVNQERLHFAMAVESGYFRTAAKYAWKHIKRSPLSFRRWKTWLALKLGKRPSRI